MNAQIEALIKEALTIKLSYRGDGFQIKEFSVGRGEINGHQVEASVVEQYRRTTGRAKQHPSITWKVDGKRVAVANLQKALE